ncbi:hypothetical protein Hdeb2414_s0009g00311041 [Helianthus debilis subsp. tardiflorus]
MGASKLSVNIAKFAVENSGNAVQAPGRNVHVRPPVPVDRNVFNVRDRRSYSDVVGKNKVSGIDGKDAGSYSGKGMAGIEKMVVVPDRTSAFKELYGSAVIGRTVDLETLVDCDKLLRIAKVDASGIQYLGGLSLIISFQDSVSANKFLDSRGIWGPWFSKLEAWGGQSLPMERVAWLSVHGIPLHLLEPNVLLQVGELFGKVLHVPKAMEEDRDLSVFKIGVLAGEAQRIREVVSLKWKDRCFRVWVEEDQDVWVPDCLEGVVGVSPVTVSTPAADEGCSEKEEGGESHLNDELEKSKESPMEYEKPGIDDVGLSDPTNNESYHDVIGNKDWGNGRCMGNVGSRRGGAPTC